MKTVPSSADIDDRARQSDRIFESIILSAKHPRSKRSANNLKAACDFLVGQKMLITISRVGSRCGNMDGGPKTQSIQNNKLFKAYVLARAAESNSRSDPFHINKIRSGKQEVDNYIECLEYEAQHLRKKLKDIAMVVPRMGEFDKKAAYATGKLVLLSVPEPVRSPTFPHPAAAAAVSKLLDQKQLQSVGLQMTPTGQIIARDHLNYILFQRHEVEALRTFVAASKA